MKVTDAMINAVRAHVPAPCSREQAQRAAEALLSSAEVREAFEAELGVKGIAEEPQEIGAKVTDADGDTWVRGRRGWGIQHNHGLTPWRSVLAYGPLRRVQ